MAAPDRNRKLLVRSAFATSATIATFVGAQTLAMLDGNQYASDTASADAVDITVADQTTSSQPTVQTVVNPVVAATAVPATEATDLVIQQAAPSLVIVRESGATSATSSTSTAANTTTSNTTIASTSGSTTTVQATTTQYTAPSPVVSARPVTQRSRSSR